MKFFLSLFFVGAVMIGFGQDEKPCNQIPKGSPDVKVEMPNWLSDSLTVYFIKENLEIDGNGQAHLKLIVDCHGMVQHVIFQKSGFGQAEEKVIEQFLLKLQLTPAEVKGKKVTSNVFLHIVVEDGRVLAKT